ncbi:MAG: hypothetical protein EXS50_01840 [Candidatus Taylorbacteria bacterium]|nr:hypothetical protein [Candidatus Taylorbacteria bacterium]
MNIELWGFKPKNCAEIETLLMAELCANSSEIGDSIQINQCSEKIKSSHWMKEPFIRVYSDDVADFTDLQDAILEILQFNGHVFQGKDMPIVPVSVECILLHLHLRLSF